MERVYGIKHGGDRSKSSNGTFAITEQDIADMNGIDINTLKRAKSLTTLPPEIQDLIEQGNISPSTASRLIAKLTSEQQEELINLKGYMELEMVVIKAELDYPILVTVKPLTKFLQMKHNGGDRSSSNNVGSVTQEDLLKQPKINR